MAELVGSVRTDVCTVTWCHITTLSPCFLSPADHNPQPTLPSIRPTPTTSTNTTRTQTFSSIQASPQTSERQVQPGVQHTGHLSSRGPAGTMSGVLRPEVTLHPPPRPPARPGCTPPAPPSTPRLSAEQSRPRALPRHQTTRCPPYTTNLPCPPRQAPSSTTRRSQHPRQTWACPPAPQCRQEVLLTSEYRRTPCSVPRHSTTS